MAGRHPNAWRERDERGHGVVLDAIGKGYDGNGVPYVIPDLPSHAAANEARKVVGRALEHFGYPRAAWVADQDGEQCYRACADENAPHQVRFELHNKNAARSHVAREAGGNPANLKYNPFQRTPKSGTAIYPEDFYYLLPPCHSGKCAPWEENGLINPGGRYGPQHCAPGFPESPFYGDMRKAPAA